VAPLWWASSSVLHERRVAERDATPLVQLDLFRHRTFVIGLLTMLVLYIGQLSLFPAAHAVLARGSG